MTPDVTVLLTLLVALAVAVPAHALREPGQSYSFCCSDDNDLFVALSRRFPRFETPAEAVGSAPDGSAVLFLADGYPAERLQIDRAVLDTAKQKSLRMYIEYPGALEGLAGEDGPRRAEWERVVVAGESLGGDLPPLRILSAHRCHSVPVSAGGEVLLCIARVAGYDSAVFGLPDDASPLLVESRDGSLLVAGTKLSGFVTGRYAPLASWISLWHEILRRLSQDGDAPRLDVEPHVRPAYGEHSRLPDGFEQAAFDAAIKGYLASRLIVPGSRAREVENLLRSGTESVPIPDEAIAGDGSFGILEGYSSGIHPDGSQSRRLPLRSDCNCEIAMVFALDRDPARADQSRATARNLLDFVYRKSDMCSGARANPEHPAFGLIGWGAFARSWTIAHYGDDNARAILGTLTAQACLGTDQWDRWVLRALLANLRTTGTLGFRLDRIDLDPLEANGWEYYAEAKTVNYSPHFESYLWACNLWAYQRTSHEPFLALTRNAIRMTMANYPNGWRWKDTIERARMLLCLAWLVRVDDTPQHRGWLKQIASDLIALQQPCGALRETFGGVGGHYQAPASNEAYGTTETPLIHADGNPASDQLYTTGFALFGLHEAAAATGDAELKSAEDLLAEYLCRIQIRSSKHPWLDGSWFRAFDYQKWDFWASSADAGWGAWSVEAGWGQAWIAATLALRQKGTSLWDLTGGSTVGRLMEEVQAEMGRNNGGPLKAGE